jgi:hypothetical protein
LVDFAPLPSKTLSPDTPSSTTLSSSPQTTTCLYCPLLLPTIFTFRCPHISLSEQCSKKYLYAHILHHKILPRQPLDDPSHTSLHANILPTSSNPTLERPPLLFYRTRCSRIVHSSTSRIILVFFMQRDGAFLPRALSNGADGDPDQEGKCCRRKGRFQMILPGGRVRGRHGSSLLKVFIHQAMTTT